MQTYVNLYRDEAGKLTISEEFHVASQARNHAITEANPAYLGTVMLAFDQDDGLLLAVETFFPK